jgi:hypothetical protein
MKFIKDFHLFESSESIPEYVNISDFLNSINATNKLKDSFVKWWDENRSRINILYFPFNTSMPIFGCVFSENTVAINSKMSLPTEFFLYILLHESKHADQEYEGRLSPYFDTVVENNFKEFSLAYYELELEANVYAEGVLIELGLEHFVKSNSQMLNQNLSATHSVFQHMKKDIERLNPENFQELIRKTIL